MTDKNTPTRHTVKEGETLSDIALKYYGSANREKWMIIYEANKAAIGDNPGLIRPGLVLEIPSLLAEGEKQAPDGPDSEFASKHVAPGAKPQRPDLHIQS